MKTILCSSIKMMISQTVTLKIVSEVATHINESMKKMVSAALYMNSSCFLNISTY